MLTWATETGLEYLSNEEEQNQVQRRFQPVASLVGNLAKTRRRPTFWAVTSTVNAGPESENAAQVLEGLKECSGLFLCPGLVV